MKKSFIFLFLSQEFFFENSPLKWHFLKKKAFVYVHVYAPRRRLGGPSPLCSTSPGYVLLDSIRNKSWTAGQ